MGTTSNDENHSMPGVPKTHPWKNGQMLLLITIRPTPQLIEEIQSRFRKLCQPRWKVLVTSRGMNSGLQPWPELHRRATDALRGAKKMDGNAKMTDLFLIDGIRIISFSTSSIWAARMDDPTGEVFGIFRQKLTNRTQRRNPSVTGLNAT